LSWPWLCPWALYFHRITVFALPVNVFILPLLAVLMPAALNFLAGFAALVPAAVLPAMVVASFFTSESGWWVLWFAQLGRLPHPRAATWQSLVFCALLGRYFCSPTLAAKTKTRRWWAPTS